MKMRGKMYHRMQMIEQDIQLPLVTQVKQRLLLLQKLQWKCERQKRIEKKPLKIEDAPADADE